MSLEIKKINEIVNLVDPDGQALEINIRDLNSILDSIHSNNDGSLLEVINLIIQSNFLQEIIYIYLQESVLTKLKDGVMSCNVDNDCDNENDNLEKRVWSEETTTVLVETIKLINKLIRKTPANFDHLVELIDRIELIIHYLNNDELKNLFNENLLELKNDHNQRQVAFKRSLPDRNNNNRYGLQPPENFRDIPLIPNLNEIKSSKDLFLRPIKTHGAYSDVEEYLDIYYRLLREDYVGSLREGIIEYMCYNETKHKSKTSKSSLMNVRVYTNVKIGNYVDSNQNIIHEINFELTDRFKKIRWESNKRLLDGSLLCLTNDNFKTAYFAVVFDRNVEKLKEGKLLVKFEDWISVNRNIMFGETEKKFNNFTLIETLAYFESYRHTLDVFKLYNENNFPFKRYIVYGETSSICCPKYLKEKRICYDFSSILQDKSTYAKNYKQNLTVPVLDIQTWPSCSLLGMDQSQYNALFSALTNELVVIQGPPGTGKTFLGVQVIKMLINNFATICNKTERGPILCVCYTNHALDQLLVLISKFVNLYKIVRIGGRSKEKILDECSLTAIKKRSGNLRFNDDQSIAYNDLRSTILRIEKLINDSHDCQFKILKFEEIEKFVAAQLKVKLFSKNIRKIVSYKNDYKNKIFRDWLGIGNLSKDFTNLEIDETIKYFDSQSILKDDDFGKFEEDSILASGNLDFNENQHKTADISEKELGYKNSNDLTNEEAEIINESRQLEDDFMEKLTIRNQMDKRGAKKDAKKDAKRDPKKTVENEERQENKNKTNIFLNWNVSKKAKRTRENKLLNSKCKAMNDNEIKKIRDLWDLNAYDRLRFYRYLCENHKNRICEDLCKLKKEYEICLRSYKNAQDKDTLPYIKDKTIIGMTTTGTAKNQNLLRLLKPKIVIAEEAAEVYESSIITCLTDSCEHLVLLGDNEQLAPSPNLYKLAKHYNLNVSLFERLVNNKIPKVRLNLQHRMRPEISFLMKHFYDDLIDDASVKNYENIKGIEKNMFFIDHNHPEEGDSDSLSKSNTYEAEYLARFCNYLLKQNYSSEQITILVAYGGQLLTVKNKIADLLKNHQKVHPDISKVKITPIDNYQGEENDIILLSLVRSNNYNSIGFLAQSNRICVALSRAKKGFYVIGNFKHLAQNSKLWSNIVMDCEKHEVIGKTLKLYCQNHPDKKIAIRNTTDFDLNLNGGCMERCGERLQCGHTCEETCHVIDNKYFQCKKPCERLLRGCTMDHKCKKLCFDKCNICNVPVSKLLPNCGHYKMLKCSDDPKLEICKTNVDFTLECGHTRLLECSNIENGKLKSKVEIKCEVVIDKYFVNCGHTVSCKCHESSNKICNTIVEKQFPDCSHKVVTKCSQELNGLKCQTLLDTDLECGHKLKAKCHEYKAYQKLRLTVRYFKDTFFKCNQMVERIRQPCGHVVRIQCHKITEVLNGNCKTRLLMKLECNHEALVDCYMTKLSNFKQLAKCDKLCSKKLDCGHSCMNKCFSCNDKHSKCTENCNKELICGHLCSLQCGIPCYTCNSNCLMKCPHTTCTKKCFEICKPCKKRCIWSCQHHSCRKTCQEYCDVSRCNVRCNRYLKCGHYCQSLCGEICICLNCEQLTDLDASKCYIRLNTCQCVLDVTYLDQHMDNEALRLNKTQGFPKCPKCKSIIYYSKRYANIIRSQQNKLHELKISQQSDNEFNKARHFLFNSCCSFEDEIRTKLQNYIELAVKKEQLGFLRNQIKMCRIYLDIKKVCNEDKKVVMRGGFRNRSYRGSEFVKNMEFIIKTRNELLNLDIEISNETALNFAIKLVMYYYYFKCLNSEVETENKIAAIGNLNEFDVDYLNKINALVKQIQTPKSIKIYECETLITPVNSIYLAKI